MNDELIARLADYECDPLSFVRWAFPWGEAGPLREQSLESWQQEVLDEIGDCLRGDQNLIRISRSTGHGIGKSGLVSMITQWAMSTMTDTKGVITANTENQLKTKTWVEIAKWHRMALTRDLFKRTATSLFSVDPFHEATWRMDMVPWSERNTEAFAGLHNEGRRIILIFDEASAIPDLIYETAEGALTDQSAQIIWLLFGNPTRNTGRFRATAPDGQFGKRWSFQNLDSRTVSLTNKTQIQEWLEDYGEDSDFFRVRVKGAFPRVDAVSFISYEGAVEATQRVLPETNAHDIVLGVDVARFGDNASVIYPRQGRDARSRRPEVYYGLSTVDLAYKVRDAVATYAPTTVFVDEGGVGGGVVDMLRTMNLPCLIHGVQFGGKPDGISDDRCANKRTEIWAEMRRWIKDGCIPHAIPGLDTSFVDELVTPTYGFNNQEEIMLEAKRDMRRRGVNSPDAADALACTFALPLVPVQRDPYGRTIPPKPTVAADYEPMEAFEHGYF